MRGFNISNYGLKTEIKRLTDAIKMACYRTETQLYETVGYHAAFARNPDEGRAFLQRMFQQPADIIPDHDENQLKVRFHIMSTQRENSALENICEVVNEEKLSYSGTNLKLVFKATCVALENA